jgi:hypothetical protein
MSRYYEAERGGGGEIDKERLFQAQRKSSSGDPERQSRSTSHFPSPSHFLHQAAPHKFPEFSERIYGFGLL